MQNAAAIAHTVAGVVDPGLRAVVYRGFANTFAGITDPGYSSEWKKPKKHLRNIMRVCGRGKFVRYRIDLIIFLRTLNHRVDKTRPVRTKYPGDAHNEIVVPSGK